MYQQVAGQQADIGQFPAFHFLATFFCSNCYDQEPTKKNGGCLGISILSSKLDLGSSWMLSHEMDFIKALLFVLKDSSPSISSCNLDEAVQTFSHVLKVCNRHDDEDSNSPDRQSKFSSLVSLLISELSNSNSVVRESIQSAFQLLADLTGNEVTEILTPVRDRLLAPIFAKPLRALPFAMQMGHVDAITYCLSLRPPLLSFSEELVRLIQEALALADAEDQALVSKSSQYKNAASLTNLRVVCIKLLSAAMANAEFNTPRQVTTRSRIISVFFKSLYSKSNEVVDCAYKGILLL
jgi:transformation/transcription domain-associated protein